jgi:cell wall-associated NlpC family hydrolase
LAIKLSLYIRKTILIGVALLLASGCAPLSPAPGSAVPPMVPPTQALSPSLTRALPPATLTDPAFAPENGVPTKPTQAPRPTLATAKTPTFSPTPNTLVARLWGIFESTPSQDYLGKPDFYSAEPDLKEFHCFTGRTESEQQDCLREAGLYYYQLYQDLPYMWGGNYPYSYSVAAALKAGGDPFLNLKPINIATVEEDRYFAGFYEGRSGKPMKAGFDCSGFTFWIMAHAGQPDFLAGKCADPLLAEKNYYRCDSPPQMQAGKVIPGVGADRVPIKTILQYGAPGDLIFTEDHVMFYLGEGEVVQSVDVELVGGDGNPPPPEAWLQEWANLHPELKMVQRGGVNRTTLEHMGTSFWIRRYTTAETR